MTVQCFEYASRAFTYDPGGPRSKINNPAVFFAPALTLANWFNVGAEGVGPRIRKPRRLQAGDLAFFLGTAAHVVVATGKHDYVVQSGYHFKDLDEAREMGRRVKNDGKTALAGLPIQPNATELIFLECFFWEAYGARHAILYLKPGAQRFLDPSGILATDLRLAYRWKP